MKSILICLVLSVSLVSAIDLTTGYFELSLYSDQSCGSTNIVEKECYALNTCLGKYNTPAAPAKWIFWKYTASNTDQTITLTTYSDYNCNDAHSIQANSNVFSLSCHPFPFEKPATGNAAYGSFNVLASCAGPAKAAGTYTGPVAQVKYNIPSGCGGGIKTAAMPRTNTCFERVTEFAAGVSTGSESAYILYEPGNSTLIEYEWSGTTTCSGSAGSQPVYTLGGTCGDEKWFAGIYSTPDVPSSGAAKGEPLFPSSAISTAVISSGLLVVLALFSMFMQKF
jgi:hypothetical protein